MSVALESGMLRSFLHRLVDGLVDELEGKATSPARPAAATTKPRIAFAEKAEKPERAKSAPAPPHKYPDVSVGCRSSCGRLEIAVSLSAEVTERLGLKAHGKAALDVHRGKLRVRRGPKTGRTLFPGGTSGRLWFATVADFFGIAEKHAAESCTFHYDLEDALLIEPPAWLRQADFPVSSPQVRSKKKNGKPQDPPASCKKMAGTNPAIKCAACKKNMASLECSLCPTLLCDGCWEAHVRMHWHSRVTSRAPTGRTAAGR